jgi:hypothetical protein
MNTTKISTIVSRAEITRHTQQDIQATWAWIEKSLAQWDRDIADIRKMQETCMTTEVIRTGARAALASSLQDMRRRMMQFMAMAKFHFSDNPVKLEAICQIKINAVSRCRIDQIALAVERAWQEAGTEWAAATEGNTFAAFQELREKCIQLRSALEATRTNWQQQTKTLNEKATALHNANVAWYAAAIRIFPEGTAVGDAIRASIPTQSSPSMPKKDPEAAAVQPAATTSDAAQEAAPAA